MNYAKIFILSCFGSFYVSVLEQQVMWSMWCHWRCYCTINCFADAGDIADNWVDSGDVAKSYADNDDKSNSWADLVMKLIIKHPGNAADSWADADDLADDWADTSDIKIIIIIIII